MKSGKPWSLRDVDHDTREAIIKAAEQSGLTVTEWMGQTGDGDEPMIEYVDETLDAADDEHPDALADAIARLSERLGVLDDKARASVRDLKGRLGEIEDRLAGLADEHMEESERNQALAGVTAMVEALVGDLDNVDERARSTVEGIGDRADHAPSPLVGEDDYGTMLSDEPTPQMDEIKHRLDDLLNEPPQPVSEPPSRTATIEAALQALEARIDDAKARLSSAPEPQAEVSASSAADQISEQIERIEGRLNEIVGRLPSRGDADLASAIREISAHQRTIDDRAETLALRRDQKALTAAMAALRADIVSLSQQVAAISRNGAADHGAMFDLARRIDALAAERPLDRDAVHEIRAELDSLRIAIAQNAERSSAVDLEARLNDFLKQMPDRPRIDALGEEVSALRRALEADEGASAVSRLEARVAELAESLDTAMSNRQTSLATPVDQLQDRLDSIAASLDSLISQPATPAAASPTVAALESRLGEMTAAINGLIDRPVAAGADVAELEKRLDAMAAGIGEQLARSPGGGAAPDIGRIESRLDDIVESINGLFFSSPSMDAANPVLKHVEGRLDDIADTVKGLMHRAPPIAEIEGLHQRLQALTERIDALNMPESDLEADLDDIKTEVASLRAVHQRLQTLTERIDNLSATQHQPLLAIAEIKDGIGAIRALHERMQTLTDRIDRLSASQRDPLVALEQFKSGVAAMRDVQERLKSLTERMDGMAIERLPELALDEIKDGIAAIRREMAGHAAPDTAHFDEQIHDLAQRLDSMSHLESEAATLAHLETQVAEIASALTSGKQESAGLRQVEERIDRLQELLADTRHESIEAARNEAREAVAELSKMAAGNEAESDLIGILMQDIESLRGAAGESEERMRAKLESINQALAQVVARLSHLEEEAAAEPAQATGTYGADPIAAAWTAAFQADDDHGRRLAEAGDESESHEPASEAELEPEGLVEPTPEGKNAADQRADFIAAARRAVQAAALEAVESGKEPGGKERPPGAFSKISQAIRKRKRTLLLAAAAIVLAIGAIRIFGGLATNNSVPVVASASEPTVPVVAAASEPSTPPAPAPRDVVAEAAAVPTIPQVTEPALVAPTPDHDIAFATPVLGTHFIATPKAPANDGSQNTGVIDPGETASVTLASAEVGPAEASVPDERVGSTRLIDAAVAGDPAAAFEVASRYAEGDRLPQDLAKAAEWYERAAEGDVAVAQYRLGSLYERGRGVAKDLAKAAEWYQRAADQGNVNAMYNLAVVMSEGVDGEPDQVKALQWFRAAADYGVRDSQYNLGVIYARGLGPAQDLVEAYKWFAIAAAQGDGDAVTRRDQLAEALTPEDIARAQAAAEAWHAKAPIVEANGVSMPAGGWDQPSDTIAEADRQALVKKIQTLLAEQGYDPGPVDGLAGPKTREAVKQFQRERGAPESGRIDNSLVALLSNDQL